MRNKENTQELLKHLESEINSIRSGISSRKQDFDFKDSPEREILRGSVRLSEALLFLQEKIVPVWQKADQRAISFQASHRLLARIVILSGTSAIVFAILQITITLYAPSWITLAKILEIIAVLSGLFAVVFGILTKLDKKWICERNRAERLRMLKFKSLGRISLWDDDFSEWKNQLDANIQSLENTFTFNQVKTWSMTERTAPEKTPGTISSTDNRETEFLFTYYIYKRIEFQADYFKRKASSNASASRPWRRLSLPIFLISVIFVLCHFFFGWLAGRPMYQDSSILFNIFTSIEIWALAVAAIIPIVGLGIRVWLGAFEPHRSANLYHSKYNALMEIKESFNNSKNDPVVLSKQVSRSELFFENEHREWLRLMLETEWIV